MTRSRAKRSRPGRPSRWDDINAALDGRLTKILRDAVADDTPVETVVLHLHREWDVVVSVSTMRRWLDGERTRQRSR